MSRKNIMIGIGVAIFLIVMTSASSATIIRVPLEPDLQEVNAPVRVGFAITMHLPEPITDWVLGNMQDYQLTRSENSSRTVKIEVLRDAPPTNLTLETWNHLVTIRFHKAAPGVEHTSRVEFYETERTRDIAMKPRPRDNDADYLSYVVTQTDTTPPVILKWQHGTHRLLVRIGAASWAKNHMSFRFEVENRGSYPYPISGIELRDKDGYVHGTTLFTPGVTLNDRHRLAHGSKLVGALKVTYPDLLRDGWVLVLRTSPGVAPARFGWNKESENRSSMQQQLAVALQVSGGAANLDDGIGIDRTAWTTAQSISARVLYGLMRYVSIEGTVDLMRANDVTFKDAMWEQTRGALAVKETAGRLMLAGLLHSGGQRWVPYTRLAVGARFSQHSVSMEARSQSQLRSGAIIGLGGGLNVRISNRLMAGVSFTYAAPLGGNDTAQTIDAGLYVGATWDLDPEW